jgi:hypothetical protein
MFIYVLAGSGLILLLTQKNVLQMENEKNIFSASATSAIRFFRLVLKLANWRIDAVAQTDR